MAHKLEVPRARRLEKLQGRSFVIIKRVFNKADLPRRSLAERSFDPVLVRDVRVHELPLSNLRESVTQITFDYNI